MSQETIIARLQQVKVLVGELINELKPKGRSTNKTLVISKLRRSITPNISFNLSLLAFMNKYSRGLSGPQKFTLLLARLAKGNTKTEIPFQELKRQWNKMKTVMGGAFNPAHANRAKAKGWVDSTKHGFYHVCELWKESL